MMGDMTNGRLFLVVNTIFYFPSAIVNIVRFLIQGMGYSRFAIFSGAFEMAARALTGFIPVPVFGFQAACLGPSHGFPQMRFCCLHFSMCIKSTSWVCRIGIDGNVCRVL